MALGDVLPISGYLGSWTSVSQGQSPGGIQPVSSTCIAFCLGETAGATVRIYTVAIDSAGVLGATIDSEAIPNSDTSYPQQFIKIAANVYAIFYQQSITGTFHIATYPITDAGAIGAQLADFNTTFGGFFRNNGTPYHISGTTYATIWQGSGPGTGLDVHTYSISADGLTISGIDSETFAYNANFYCDMVHISGDVYCAVAANGTDNIKAWSFTISAAGTISVAVDSEEIDGVATSTNVSVSSVTSGIVCFSYTISGNNRLRTYGLTDAGVFGTALATNDTINYTRFTVYPLGSRAFLFMGSTNQSIQISTDGLGITLLDTGTNGAVSGCGQYSNVFGNIFVMFSYSINAGSGAVKSFSVEQLSTAPSYPTDTSVRVTGITRTFWSGKGGQAQYLTELTLGGEMAGYISPVDNRTPPPVIPDQPQAQPKQKMDYSKYWKLPGNQGDFSPMVSPFAAWGTTQQGFQQWLVSTPIEVQKEMFGRILTVRDYPEWLRRVSH